MRRRVPVEDVNPFDREWGLDLLLDFESLDLDVLAEFALCGVIDDRLAGHDCLPIPGRGRSSSRLRNADAQSPA